ncbi:MFS transporter [Clavibacter michiganensis]|uniref:Bicyclomycin/multidrug efflux system n=1 Tax=Clavibacter michiganensis TaxID=28447 RepID=A0A251YNZ2_9MICO|nr:MFS transporter [Clavibacter michiganensis]OUE25873.1 bicyclomycin/multidrug efflux system [Clavibacter michiganensis]
MSTTAPAGVAEPDPAAPPRRRVAAWALWDWGSAAFNAVVTTFVFSTYLASSLFVDPAIVAAAGDDARNPALVAAKADTSGVISLALTIAGLLIAVLAPVLGQRSDGSGRRRLWLGINTGVVVLAMLGMVFVEPVPSYLWLGAVLLATGNVFFEFASVNYNAMLVQVSTPRTVGRVSGLGWGMGYVGGIVLLALLLGLFLFDFGVPGASGLLALPSGAEGGALDVRIAILVAAIWCAVFSIPVLVGVPEIPATPGRKRQGVVASYRTLFRRIAELYRESPRVIVFLIASAVFRDGLAAVFTFGAIIAAQVFGFTTTEVLLFGVAANVVAGIGTFAAGWFDDRFGAKPVILVSLACLIVGGSAVLAVGDAKAGFWATGLFLCLFVGPVQSSSRTFLARISPAGREGEMFGLYTTTGRAVSFLAPGLFGIAVAITGDTRFGIIGIVIVLLAGLLLMLRVRGADARAGAARAS